MTHLYETVNWTSDDGQFTVTLPVNSDRPAKYTIKRMDSTMTNTTVAFKVTGIDGNDLGTVEAVRAEYADGIVVFTNKAGVQTAFFNQDAVRGWVPVTETEAPELTPGAYGFEIEVEGGNVRKVTADEYVHETHHAGEEPFITVLFRTKVGASFRKELSLNAAEVKAIVRVDPVKANGKARVTKTA